MTNFANVRRAAMTTVGLTLALAAQAFGSDPGLPKYTPDELKAREAKFSQQINIGTASAEKLSTNIRTFLKSEFATVARTGGVTELKTWDQAMVAIGVDGTAAPLKSWKPVFEIYRAHMLEQDNALTIFKTANPSGTQDAFWKTMPSEWSYSTTNYKFMNVSKAFVGQDEEWAMAIGYEVIGAGESYMPKTAIYANDMLRDPGYFARMNASNPHRTLESVANWIDACKGYTSAVSSNRFYFDNMQDAAIKKAAEGRYVAGPEPARKIAATVNSNNAKFLIYVDNFFQAAIRPPPQAGINNSRGATPGG
ncbi:MAG TPA: hypothetical protein PKW15_06050 [Alphaproteobacteria bacterium]|nr:hypothetical protein [Alphaproteobacteria bacterium]